MSEVPLYLPSSRVERRETVGIRDMHHLLPDFALRVQGYGFGVSLICLRHHMMTPRPKVNFGIF